MNRISQTAAVVISAVLSCAGTAVAAPTWSSPIDVSPGDTDLPLTATPSAVYGNSRVLTLAWTSDRDAGTTLPTAQRSPAGAFAVGPSLVTAPGAADPSLARGSGGELYAAWVIGEGSVGDGVVMAGRLQPNGAVMSSQRLSAVGEDASEPAIAVGADGRVAVTWATFTSGGDGQIRAVHGALGGPALTRRVVSAGELFPSSPDLAFDSAGVVNVVWAGIDAQANSAVKAAVEQPNGTFGGARIISAANASDPSLVSLPGGGLGFAWTQEAAGEIDTVHFAIEPTPNAPLGQMAVPGGGESSAARLAVDPSGALYVAWIRVAGGQSSVLVSARNSTGALDDPPHVLSTDSATGLDLAFSPAGDAIVTWRRNLGTTANPSGDVRAAVYDAPGAPPPPPPPPPGSVPLGLGSLGATTRCIRYGAPFGGPRRRLSFTFSLSEPATTVLKIQRRLNSRSHRRCPVPRPPGDAGLFGPPLVVQMPAPSGPGEIAVGDEGQVFSQQVKSGFPARILMWRTLGAGRRRVVVRQSPTALAPGTYVASLSAITADGRHADAGHVKFWVLKPAHKG